MKLKDLIAVCGAENITVAIPLSYFTKNKALYDLANRTRHTDAYGSFHREGTRGSKPVEGYITAVLTEDTHLLKIDNVHTKFLRLYRDEKLMADFAEMTVAHAEPILYSWDDAEALRVVLVY